MPLRNLKRRLAAAASAIGLGPAVYRALDVARRMRHPRKFLENVRLRRDGASDGLPIPPDHLLYLVGGAADVAGFLNGGSRAAGAIRSQLEAVGRPIESFDDVLDFGCGCGRVIRHWNGVVGPRFHGCDYNPKLVRWCERNLSFARFAVNGAEPPLPFPDQSFDLVYALSVWTHLPEAMQRPWMDEIRRVLRPGGVLLLTVHGEPFLRLLEEPERQRFRAGELVVTNPEYAGTNLCAAFHPELYVHDVLARGWRVLAYNPQGALGNGRQDQYVLEMV